MTAYRTHVAPESPSWPLGLRRAGQARPAVRSVRSRRRALGWIAAALIEGIVVVGTVTALLGIGFEGQTGPLPTPAPAPAPSYEVVPAPAPDAGRLFAAAPLSAPAPLPAPAPLLAPVPVAAGD